MAQVSKDNLRLALELQYQRQANADNWRLMALELRNILLEHGIKPPEDFPALPPPEEPKNEEQTDETA